MAGRTDTTTTVRNNLTHCADASACSAAADRELPCSGYVSVGVVLGGKSWTRLTAAAPWAERDNFNAEVTPEGYLVVTGGYNSRETLNDGRTQQLRHSRRSGSSGSTD